MGRIGHSLIMPGQLPHCSLFSVCWADDGLRVPVRVLARACVCIHKHEFLRWDKAMAGKRDPTLSRPPTPPPQVYASPNWILYYRRSQVWTTHFPLPLFAFFHSFPLSPSRFYFCVSFFLFMSVLSFISPFLLAFSSWYSEHVFSFRSACLCDLCCPHLPVWLNPPICVMEHIAVIRMITIWPAPLPRGAESQSIIKFLHCLLCVCLLKWSDWPYLLNNSTLLGNANVSLWCECVYMNF